jgi:hypothetical protein
MVATNSDHTLKLTVPPTPHHRRGAEDAEVAQRVELSKQKSKPHLGLTIRIFQRLSSIVLLFPVTLDIQFQLLQADE